MKQNKVLKHYRFHPVLVEKIKMVADESECSNTSVIEQALMRFFEEYENFGYMPEIFKR